MATMGDSLNLERGERQRSSFEPDHRAESGCSFFRQTRPICSSNCTMHSSTSSFSRSWDESYDLSLSVFESQCNWTRLKSLSLRGKCDSRIFDNCTRNFWMSDKIVPHHRYPSSRRVAAEAPKDWSWRRETRCAGAGEPWKLSERTRSIRKPNYCRETPDSLDTGDATTFSIETFMLAPKLVTKPEFRIGAELGISRRRAASL